MKRLLWWLLFAALPLAAQTTTAQTNPCTGSPQPLHCNIISITPGAQPAGVTVASWNVYKGSSSGGYKLGTPFATVANPATLTFQDSTVTSGQTNFYALTAVDTQGAESPFSNELKSVTPLTQPATPSITVTSF